MVRPKIDAIIVLAAGIRKDHNLSKIAKLRVDKGIELYRKKYAKMLIFPGGSGFVSNLHKLFNKNLISESEAMRRYAISKGIHSKRIVIEEESKDTIGNAYFSKKITESRKWYNLIIVTADYHMKRVKYIFDKVFDSKYKIHYVAAQTNYGEYDKASVNAEENRLLGLTKRKLDKIKRGDDSAFRMLLNKHFLYLKLPRIIHYLIAKFYICIISPIQYRKGK